MLDIISTLFSQVVRTLWDEGPIGMAIATAAVGWAVAIWLFLKSKRSVKKTEPTALDYLRDIKNLHDKYLSSINDLNEKYHTSLLGLSEKRVSDMKDLNASYNAIARDLLATLDKIANNIKISDEDI